METFVWIVILVFGFIQLIMIFKFFEIASNINDIRNYIISKDSKEKSGNEQQPDNDSIQENTKEPEPIKNKVARIVFYIVLICAVVSLIMFYI